jgi:hypothetical protein
MITLDQYFRDFKHTDAQRANASLLLNRVNLLISDAAKYGVILKTNKNTGSMISGDTFGGFRPKSCTIGAPGSSHKEAMAVDVYDPQNALDGWLDDIKLLKYDLYREHPEYSNGWCHLSTKSPRSGRRTFLP